MEVAENNNEINTKMDQVEHRREPEVFRCHPYISSVPVRARHRVKPSVRLTSQSVANPWLKQE